MTHTTNNRGICYILQTGIYFDVKFDTLAVCSQWILCSPCSKMVFLRSASPCIHSLADGLILDPPVIQQAAFQASKAASKAGRTWGETPRFPSQKCREDGHFGTCFFATHIGRLFLPHKCFAVDFTIRVEHYVFVSRYPAVTSAVSESQGEVRKV